MTESAGHRGFWDKLFPGRRRRRQLRELGARFEPNGRDEYLYCEGDRRLPIYAERVAGEYDVAVHETDSVGAWLPPHAHEPLSAERRRAIFALFLRYLAIFDYRVQIERGEGGEDTRA